MGNQILFVDDDAEWRAMVTAGLKEAGYQVRAVADASEALLQASDGGFSLIILDLDLAGENGLMLMNYLKCNYPTVPIVLYTGMEHEPEVVEQMRLLGARQYLRKGEISELAETVKKILD